MQWRWAKKWVVMRWMVAIVVLAVGSGASAGRLDPPAERWARTDLTLELSKTFISNEKCNSSITYLESCVEAIKAANALIQDPVSLVGNDVNFEITLSEITRRLAPTVPPQLMLGEAINAHLQWFDAHAYLAPSDNFQAKDNYTGLGLFVRKLESGFFVTEVIEGSAAAAANMDFGDLIVGVTGLSPDNFSALSVNELGQLLRGPIGTHATIQFERDGVFESLTLTRAKVNGKAVVAWHSPSDSSLGVIRVREFIAGQTCDAFRQALEQLEETGVNKLILDLRANMGGSTQDALCVASLFLGWQDLIGVQPVAVRIPEKDLIPIYNPSPELRWIRGSTFVADPIPLVVLVDSRTASAAEILAGSLQALERAWLVGERTWGKGTQQTFAELAGHATIIIAATTDRVFLPNLKSPQRVGLTPSFPADISVAPIDLKNLEPESEATAFPGGLDAVNEAWPGPRRERSETIRDCIAKDHLDTKILAELGPMSGDYQKAYAAAVLSCDRP